MTDASEAARHIAEATGPRLRVIASRQWQSAMFHGHRMLLEFDADLPPDVDQMDFNVPGFAVADIAKITLRRAEALPVTMR